MASYHTEFGILEVIASFFLDSLGFVSLLGLRNGHRMCILLSSHCLPHLFISRTSINGGAGPHFYACHCILPLIKVEVESGMFGEGLKEILESVTYSHLISGNGLDGRKQKRKGIVYQKSP